MHQTPVFAPEWIDGYISDKLKVNGICLKQDSVSFPHNNLYLSYTLDTCPKDVN